MATIGAEVVWAVEVSNNKIENANLILNMLGNIKEELESCDCFRVSFLYVLNPHSAATFTRKHAEPLNNHQIQGKKRLIYSDLIDPVVKNLESCWKKYATSVDGSSRGADFERVIASWHIEVNEKRDAGLIKAAEHLQAVRLYMFGKKKIFSPQLDRQSEYCSQHIPQGCALIVFQHRAVIRHLESSYVPHAHLSRTSQTLTQVLTPVQQQTAPQGLFQQIPISSNLSERSSSSTPVSTASRIASSPINPELSEDSNLQYVSQLQAYHQDTRYISVEEMGPRTACSNSDGGDSHSFVEEYVDGQFPVRLPSAMAASSFGVSPGQGDPEGSWGSHRALQGEEIFKDVIASEGFQEFSAAAILQMCRGFDESLVIGKGRFGTVYKGTYARATVAVKRFKDEQIVSAIASFKQEREVYSSLRHPNIVLLMGYCKQPACLVYEFMAQGSLQDRLRGSSAGKPLSWIQRYKIFEGVYQGLLHLHTRHIDLEIKSANILLDNNLTPKLSYIGIAQFIADAPSSQQVSQSVATVGSMSTYHGRFDDESLVLSLGRLLKGLLMSQESVGESEWHGVMEWVGGHVDDGEMGNVLNVWPSEVAKRLCELATECCREGMFRPQLDGGVLKVILRLEPLIRQCVKEKEQKLESLRLSMS